MYKKDESVKGCGPSYVPLCTIEEGKYKFEFKYEIMSGYLNVVQFQVEYGCKKWRQGYSSRRRDISQIDDLREKIRQKGDDWRRIKTKDPENDFYEQRDIKGQRTGIYKLITNEYKTSRRIERYYIIEELRHEI